MVPARCLALRQLQNLDLLSPPVTRGQEVCLPWPPAAEGTGGAGVQGVDTRLGLLPPPSHPGVSQQTHINPELYVHSSPKPVQLRGRARLSHTIWQPWGPKHGQGPADYPVMDFSLGSWGDPQSQVLFPEQKAHAGIFAHNQCLGPVSRSHPGGLSLPIPQSGPLRRQLRPIPGQGTITRCSKEPSSLLKF